jgi:hypothetical protein
LKSSSVCVADEDPEVFKNTHHRYCRFHAMNS